jgi:hypothetical protein
MAWRHLCDVALHLLADLGADRIDGIQVQRAGAVEALRVHARNLPAQAQVQGQLRADLPGVVDVK